MAEKPAIRSMFEFQKLTLSTTDYLLFGSLISLSLLIGLYFGFVKRQKTTNEYLFGGKTMNYFPVAISMLAGHVSGITLLGTPTEVYQHGSTYLLIVITVILTCFAITDIFLPVFYKLQLSSTYEYLELRFCHRIRILASSLYAISLIIYIPLVVYVPALAFTQVTGYSLHAIVPVLCVICIIYTSLGGVKAVIWTDTIQFFFTMGGLLAVFVIGVRAVGSLSTVWSIAEKGNRTEIFNMDPSLYVRKTFWGMSFSMTAYMLVHLGISQNCVQRFLSIPTERDVRKAIVLLGVGLIVMKIICALTGLNMYAWYRDCDPLRAKIIKRSDQILPYYVMDIAGDLAGLPGVFLAGLVSCALSTMSAALNTLAGTIYDDFIEHRLSDSSNKEEKATTIMKIISVLVGLIGMTMTFMIQHLGTIFELSVSIRSIVDGPLLGLFVLGILVPWVGRKGALCGSLLSLVLMKCLVFGYQWNVYLKRITYPALPTSVDNCPFALNDTSSPSAADGPIGHGGEPFFIFKISMLHFSLVGMLLTVIGGVVTSYVFGEFANVDGVNPDHVTPFMRRFIPKKQYTEVPLKEINSSATSGNGINKSSHEDIGKKTEISH